MNIETQHKQNAPLTGSRVRSDSFERLLSRLGPDPEVAGQKYECIRGRLINMFKARRCVFAEDLADVTIERVTRKLSDLNVVFSSDPSFYFYGVAKKIYLEHQRKLMLDYSRFNDSQHLSADKEEWEKILNQLDEALSVIPESDRELVLKYYTSNGRDKINHRRALAAQFGLGPNALRLRVFRIRRELKNYMLRSSKDFMTVHKGA